MQDLFGTWAAGWSGHALGLRPILRIDGSATNGRSADRTRVAVNPFDRLRDGHIRRYLVGVVDSPETDPQLVARALGGNVAAWQALVERYGGLVFATARKAGLTRDDAEDAAQTVFASLLQSLGAVRDVDRLAKWLIVTTKREAWRMQRVRKRHSGGGSDVIDVVVEERRASDEGDDEATRHERRQTVLRALGSIDARCQELLRAMFLGAGEGDYTAIGERFGIAANSVGPIRNRCLRRLLGALEELGFEPSEHGFPGVPSPSG